MDDDQQFCLRWNNHQSTLISVFDTLLENGTLVDCTLAAEGKFLKAHKVVLSACSPYFATLLQEQYDKHPIFILKDVKYQELRAMMDYMYRGEVNISQDQLAALLKAAESLQIKGLSDNRSGAPRTEHHRGLNVPAVATSGGASGGSGKISGGYTLEQTKRARIGPSSMDSQDLSGSREGSSSPSRRRRKIRRRSIENVMTEAHENSNSSQIQSNQSTLLQQSNANLAGVGAISAAASALATQIQVSAATLPTGTTGVTPLGANQGATQQLTTSVTKKTESVKGTSDAMNTDNVQAGAAAGADDQEMEHGKGDKLNHKHKSSGAGGGKDSELVIQPKSEYDEEGNEETVEDLTLDEEDMGMDDLDHNAGTSQGGEGSSQGYAAWQHDRSQDELLLATQDAQQRDPQDLLEVLSIYNGMDREVNELQEEEDYKRDIKKIIIKECYSKAVENYERNENHNDNGNDDVDVDDENQSDADTDGGDDDDIDDPDYNVKDDDDSDSDKLVIDEDIQEIMECEDDAYDNECDDDDDIEYYEEVAFLDACKVCGMRFRNHAGLRLHKTKTDCVSQNYCRKCSLSFDTYIEMSEHLFAVHKIEQDRSFIQPTCFICNKKFLNRNLYALKRHLREVHTNVYNKNNRKC